MTCELSLKLKIFNNFPSEDCMRAWNLDVWRGRAVDGNRLVVASSEGSTATCKVGVAAAAEYSVVMIAAALSLAAHLGVVRRVSGDDDKSSTASDGIADWGVGMGVFQTSFVGWVRLLDGRKCASIRRWVELQKTKCFSRTLDFSAHLLLDTGLIL